MENFTRHVCLLNSQDCCLWCLEGPYVLPGAQSTCIKRYSTITSRALTIANSAHDFRTTSVSSHIWGRWTQYRRRSLSTSSSIVSLNLVVIGWVGVVIWLKVAGGRVHGGRHFCEYLWCQLHKNLNPNRGSCSTYARIQYSKLTFLALFAVKARRKKWKYNGNTTSV